MVEYILNPRSIALPEHFNFVENWMIKEILEKKLQHKWQRIKILIMHEIDWIQMKY